MRDSRALAMAKVTILAALWVALWTWLFVICWCMGFFRAHLDFHGVRALRLVALPFFLIGFVTGLRCVFNFAWIGRGTPAPIDPPRVLVVAGPHAYVRNPMYVGFGTAIVAVWVLLGPLTWFPFVAFAVLALAIHLFVRLYEEPTLRRKFGADYEEYCRNVRRWLPRLHPWKGHADAAGR